MKIEIDMKVEWPGMEMEQTGKFKDLDDAIKFLEKLKENWKDEV